MKLHFNILAACTISILLLNCSMIQTPEPKVQTNPGFRGIVFEDINHNGVQDSNESGIKNVVVSNQYEVTSTDANGCFSLPLRSNTTVYVTKPAGYEYPVNENNLPEFYYHYFPEGSPAALEYAGLSKPENTAEKISFPLYKTKSKNEFKILVMGDPQPRTETEIDYLRDAIFSEIKGSDYQFSIALGDIMFDKLDLFPRYNQIAGKIGCPLFNVAGNHDLNYCGNATHKRDTFRKYYGPSYYSFNHGKVHFIITDNVEWTGKHTKSWWGDYRGLYGKEQLEWIKEDLKYVPKDHAIVISQHIPLFSLSDGEGKHSTADRKELYTQLQEYENVLFLAGHTHTNEFHSIDEKESWIGQNSATQIIAGAACGCWFGGPKDERGIPAMIQSDGVPSGYYEFTFKGKQYSQKFFPAGYPEDFQLRISLPNGVVSTGESEIIVNVFNADPATTVKVVIDGKESVTLARTPDKDPFVSELIGNNKSLYKSWAGASDCSHLWKGKMPSGLTPGAHTITATAIVGGKEYTEKKIFEKQ